MRIFVPLGCAALLAGWPAYAQNAAPVAEAATSAAAEEPVDARAVDALKRMSGFLTSLQTFRLTSVSTLDVVTADDQKVQLDAVSHYQVKRPGIVIDLKSDQRSRQYYYDGKQFTVFAPQLGYYSTVPAPPTNREFLAEIYARTGIQLPLEDLFRWADQDNSDIAKLTSAFNAGTATIDGAATDHWVFRTDEFDWEIWIEQGDRPVPRKYVLIDRTDSALPAFSARLAWELNPALDAAAFTFVPGADAIAIPMATPQETAQ
ncbi:MAG TPA: DUF2092 domain-containing protein [Croceibacterium sp.]